MTIIIDKIMEKSTPIEYTAPNGRKIVITVHRTWGTELLLINTSDDLEEIRAFERNPEAAADVTEGMIFTDRVSISVRAGGRTYEDVRIGASYTAPTNRVLVLDGHTVLDLPVEIWEDIDRLREERLNEEIPPSAAERIRLAKKCTEEGHVLPRSELQEKLKEDWEVNDDDLMSLFSPYEREWISEEEVAELRKRYPEQFRTRLTREYVGRKLREAREDAGLSLRDLAEKTGIGHGHIGKIERGQLNVSVDTLETLLDALGLSVTIE